MTEKSERSKYVALNPKYIENNPTKDLKTLTIFLSYVFKSYYSSEFKFLNLSARNLKPTEDIYSEIS